MEQFNQITGTPRDIVGLESAIGLDALNSFAKEVEEWRAKQGFLSTSPFDPLLGMAEELGELCEHLGVHNAMVLFGKMNRCELKAAQGIGQDRDKWVSEYESHRDALILLLQSDQCDAGKKFGVPNTITAYDSFAIHWAKVRDSIGDLSVYTADLTRRLSIRFGDAVSETWERVKSRNWVKDKKTGGDNEKIAEQVKQ